jgi:preprotein translocase subunit SecD
MLNRTPWWQYILFVVLVLASVVYAIPSLYGENPAVEIAFANTSGVDLSAAQKRVEAQLTQQHLAYHKVMLEDHSMVVTFNDNDQQLAAYTFLASAYEGHQVTLALRARAPAWFAEVGAHPIKLGLDLRGGVHFLLDVDVNAVVRAKMDGDVQDLKRDMRDQNIRYSTLKVMAGNRIAIGLQQASDLPKVKQLLAKRHQDYQWLADQKTSYQLQLTQAAYQALSQRVISQNMSTLTNRVNELGVAEAVVQQQGTKHISVDLPGIQDVARAKELLGKTATLRFQLVDESHDLAAALRGDIPLGSRLYDTQNKQSILLKEQVILTGKSITNASTGIDQGGQPDVQISLGGGGESSFYQATAKNIGKRLAVIYVETKAKKRQVNGKVQVSYKQLETVISSPVINAALGNQFIITGRFTQQEVQQLALLLRSGSFAAPVSIIEERTVGPSLGAANIQKGMLSLVVGSLLVVVFMALYYRLFGLLADLALCLNVLFIVSILSILEATLTLAGMAGIVLTVGMAVDANVLIYERIREELRLGRGVQMAINLGYGRALVTIVDSNVTTLIVAVILFALGSASVKGFAVTLTVGLLASMVTAIVLTRAMVNALYGGKRLDRVSIGI